MNIRLPTSSLFLSFSGLPKDPPRSSISFFTLRDFLDGRGIHGRAPKFLLDVAPQVPPGCSAKRSSQTFPDHFQESFRSFVPYTRTVFFAIIPYLYLQGPPVWWSEYLRYRFSAPRRGKFQSNSNVEGGGEERRRLDLFPGAQSKWRSSPLGGRRDGKRV